MPPQVKYLSADGATQITSKTWPQQVSDIAEVLGTPLKFAVENNGARDLGVSPFSGAFLEIEQVGTGDGYLYALTTADPVTVSRPWGEAEDAAEDPTGGPTVVLGATADGGVWGALDTYGYVVVATNATGATIASVETEVVVNDATKRATITWVETPNATGYKLYRTDVPGTYGANTLRATIGSGATVTFVDDGTATGVGTPAVTNTTAGAGPTYGTQPADGAFTVADKAMGVLAVGQQHFFWARLKIPAGTSEVGNQRTFRILPREV